MALSNSLRVLITAVDRLTPVLNSQMRHISRWRRTLQSAGRGAVPMALGLGAALAIPARAFIEAEDAATGLKNALMTKDGLTYGFSELSKIATELGTQLPGSTADIMAMATILRSNSMNVDTMIKGGLKATAYLGAATKTMGESYDSAALAIAKTSNVFGVANDDFIELADTMQRVRFLGMSLEDFTESASKAGGALKGIKYQGLGAVKELAPLIALLKQSGIDASEAGTGIKTIINEFVSTGKFTTITQMVKDLEKMSKLEPKKLFAIFAKAFDKLHAGKAQIIAAGGYDKLSQSMENQASLMQRVANSLQTLGALWEAALGTIQNTMVAFTDAYATELKTMTAYLNTNAEALGKWFSNNGYWIKAGLQLALAFVGSKLAVYGLGLALAFVQNIMRTNPLVALGTAAILIYQNWDQLATFFKDTFGPLIDSLAKKWASFTAGIKSGVDFIKTLGGILEPTAGPGMRPPGHQSNLVRSGRVSGAIDVNFNNTPQGTRVTPNTKGPISVTPSVGYRSLSMLGNN